VPEVKGQRTEAVQPVAVEGRTLKIISAKRLLSLKRAIKPPRDKDIFDIKQLERIVDEDERA
jgi:hypothetical protein